MDTTTNRFMAIVTTVAIIILLLNIFCNSARSEEIDISIISQIESSNDPSAYNNQSRAVGLNQITPICLKEWNNYHPSKNYSNEDLFIASINTDIADWYINKRIPQMIRHYGKPDTVENRLIAYNAGISYVVSGKTLPSETINYIKKYRRMM